ncbi:MAG: hypothetical protein AB8C95_09465 [Phycisphaeraceae bacterium]
MLFTTPALLALIGGVLLGSASFATSALPADAKPLAVQSVQDDAQLTPEQMREKRRQIAEERRKEREAEQQKDAIEAMEIYERYEAAYLSHKMEEVQEMYLEMRSKQRHLSREKQAAIRHMNEYAPKYRPKWWQGTKKQEKNSFEAEIWGKDFWANYVPSRELGLQAVYPEQEYNRKTGEWEVVDLTILVTWKPLMVDSTQAAGGKLAEMHGYTLGDIAEVIVWHELGHNYITETISTRDNIQLYDRYSDLYSTMHEYFADMAAIYHGTPRARKMAIQFRLEELDYYTKDSSHCRGAHGIGAIIITDMLMNPDKWPSVHYPPSVPKQQVELNTIIYVYENLPPKWTAEEDIRLQQLAEEFVMKHGKKTFKSKGEIPMANRLKFKLMIGEDGDNQVKRDEWVKNKLEGFISEGRADKLEKGEKYDPPKRDKNRRREFHSSVTIVDGQIVREDNNEELRIEVPWDF